MLIVRLLRLLEQGSTRPGLLGGLADPRLSRAIVAMHERPGHLWRVETLADEAGLSVSRFFGTVSRQGGHAAAGYLRNWRLILARQDIEGGARIQSVARRYGFSVPQGGAEPGDLAGLRHKPAAIAQGRCRPGRLNRPRCATACCASLPITAAPGVPGAAAPSRAVRS